MKVLAVLFIVAPIFGVLATTPEELAAKIQSHHQECSKSSKVDAQVLANARKGQIDESNVPLREHLFCYGKRTNLINEAGDFQENVVKSKLQAQIKDSSAVDKVMETCKSVKKSDDLKLYFVELVACYYKNVPSGVVIF